MNFISYKKLMKYQDQIFLLDAFWLVLVSARVVKMVRMLAIFLKFCISLKRLFKMTKILRIKASISIQGSVLLIMQKHCKTPLKTLTVHSNSYTTF